MLFLSRNVYRSMKFTLAAHQKSRVLSDPAPKKKTRQVPHPPSPWLCLLHPQSFTAVAGLFVRAPSQCQPFPRPGHTLPETRGIITLINGVWRDKWWLIIPVKMSYFLGGLLLHSHDSREPRDIAQDMETTVPNKLVAHCVTSKGKNKLLVAVLPKVSPQTTPKTGGLPFSNLRTLRVIPYFRLTPPKRK